MRSFTTLILALSLPLYALAAHGNARRHSGLAHRARGDVLEKRGFSGRLTFYDINVGITACGGTYQPGDFVVALNQAMFGFSYPSPYCGKTITLTVNGKTANAKIVDSCPGCPYGGLDLTRGLFGFYADLGVGVLEGSWTIGGEAPQPTKEPDPTTTQPKHTSTSTHEDPPPSSTPTPKHTTTSPPPPPPSTTPTSSKKPTTSTTPTTSSTTSTTTTSTTRSHSSSTPSLSPSLTPSPSPSSGLGQPGGVIPSDGTQNLEALNEAIIYLGGLVEACNDE